MVDPVAEVVTLLQPSAPFSKIVSGAGRWSVRRSEYGQPFFCVILDGSCRLAVDGHEPITLQEGDFVLIPSARLTFPRVTSLPRTIMRPLVKLTSRRIWSASSHPARTTAGVMNLAQISDSLRFFLFIQQQLSMASF